MIYLLNSFSLLSLSQFIIVYTIQKQVINILLRILKCSIISCNESCIIVIFCGSDDMEILMGHLKKKKVFFVQYFLIIDSEFICTCTLHLCTNFFKNLIWLVKVLKKFNYDIWLQK